MTDSIEWPTPGPAYKRNYSVPGVLRYVQDGDPIIGFALAMDTDLPGQQAFWTWLDKTAPERLEADWDWPRCWAKDDEAPDPGVYMAETERMLIRLGDEGRVCFRNEYGEVVYRVTLSGALTEQVAKARAVVEAWENLVEAAQ